MVHSFYATDQPSGENAAVEAQLEALRRAGHHVRLFATRTDEARHETGYPLRSAWRVATGYGRSPLSAIREFDPDVVHVHNLFPNFGRRWVTGLDAPLVVTLHNYRPVCANGLLYRNGEICTRCLDGMPWSGVRFGCYRGSRLASLPLALANRPGPGADPLLSRADVVVTLSERQRHILVTAGMERERIVAGRNFLPDALDPGYAERHTGHEDGWLFVGRLAPEKGVLELVRRWPHDESLTIVGDGPERAAIADAAEGREVRLLGPVGRSEVLRLAGSHCGLVFPSRGFEALPLVIIEALAAGLPILAYEPASVAGLVRQEGVGNVVTWRDDVSQTLAEARTTFPALRRRCRDTFERCFSESQHVRHLIELYGAATHRRRERMTRATVVSMPSDVATHRKGKNGGADDSL